MENQFAALHDQLGYHFKDPLLLAQAVRHRSAGKPHNERLEFLGDAILGCIISAELYRHHPKAKEGELSRMRSSLVNSEVLASLATELGLSEHLELGAGERKSGGGLRQSILADTLEALIGAIYLDSGFESVRSCVIQWFGDKVSDLSRMQAVKDAKSELQEILQSRKLPLPHYECVAKGPAHQQVFQVTCTVMGLDFKTEGKSSSRRKAEQIAAELFLELLL